MSTLHTYKSKIIWTGNKGTGTTDYKSYERSHIISIENKVDIQATSDPAFRGDKKNTILKIYFYHRFLPVTCCGIYIYVQRSE